MSSKCSIVELYAMGDAFDLSTNTPAPTRPDRILSKSIPTRPDHHGTVSGASVSFTTVNINGVVFLVVFLLLFLTCLSVCANFAMPCIQSGTKDLHTAEAGTTAQRLGEALALEGDHGRSADFFTMAVGALEPLFGTESTQVVESMTGLGFALLRQVQYSTKCSGCGLKALTRCWTYPHLVQYAMKLRLPAGDCTLLKLKGKPPPPPPPSEPPKHCLTQASSCRALRRYRASRDVRVAQQIRAERRRLHRPWKGLYGLAWRPSGARIPWRACLELWGAWWRRWCGEIRKDTESRSSRGRSRRSIR